MDLQPDAASCCKGQASHAVDAARSVRGSAVASGAWHAMHAGCVLKIAQPHPFTPLNLPHVRGFGNG